MNTLSGKHALVTGGGTGVGAAIATELAQAGVNVTITGRRQQPLDAMASTYENILAVHGDVSDEISVKKMFDNAVSANGPISIVIANAGAAQSAPLSKTTLNTWNHMLNVNLTGVFLTFREALRRLEKNDWGRLIAVASTAGLKGYAYTSGYCAAKHGVIGLVRSLAVEAARSNITVNAVCPGFTETPLLADAIANIIEKTGMTEEEARATLSATNPQGRFVQPGEVAEAVMWLVGNNSDAITGQAISISGGETS